MSETFSEGLVAFTRVSQELLQKRQERLTQLIQDHGVLEVLYEAARATFGAAGMTFVLGNGKEVNLRPSGTCLEDDLSALDPEIKRLEAERRALGKKHHLLT